MKLYIIQHGEALAESVDPDRPLSDAGTTDIRDLSEMLLKAGASPARIYHSGKTRAQQSAEILGRVLGREDVVSATDGLSPKAPPRVFVEGLDGIEEDLMLVSHQPFVGKLVATLICGDDTKTVVDFEPGTLVCLVRHADFGWVVDWIHRPSLSR